MRKAIIAAVAAVIVLAPTPLLAAFGGLLTSGVILATPAPMAHADPLNDPKCGQFTGQDYANCAQGIQRNLEANLAGCENMASIGASAAQIQECEDGVRAHNRVAPPAQVTTQAPATTPAQAPNNTPTLPVTKPAVVAPPKGLDAPPEAIAAAKSAPATQVDPANPPPAPTQRDFNQQVQSVITTHNANIDVVNGLAHPRHWDYIDYDENHHPILYNPLSEAMTFRYFYSGDYREVYVAASSSVVLNVGVDGVFPFTAVGDNYLTSGSFYGGSPPAVYQDVVAYIPAYNETVQVGKVQQVGHDDSQPAGSQDTFMLDDSTLAWGQANNPSDGGQITVTKTQTLPGVGPTDDGKSLVDLAVAAHQQPTHNWWPWLLGGGVLMIAAGLVAWMATRRKGTQI
jgi:hypothetical protein